MPGLTALTAILRRDPQRDDAFRQTLAWELGFDFTRGIRSDRERDACLCYVRRANTCKAKLQRQLVTKRQNGYDVPGVEALERKTTQLATQLRRTYELLDAYAEHHQAAPAHK